MELDGCKKAQAVFFFCCFALSKEVKLYSMKWAKFQENSSLRISIINYFVSRVSEMLLTKQNETKLCYQKFINLNKMCRDQESAGRQQSPTCCRSGKTTGTYCISVNVPHWLEHLQPHSTKWVPWFWVGISVVSQLSAWRSPRPWLGAAKKGLLPDGLLVSLLSPLSYSVN